MWPDLPPDLLREISSRVHVAADFVRFHAVCKPWRSSHEPTSVRKKKTDQFLPWLLARNNKHDHHLKFRCVFSKFSYLAPISGSGTGNNWVASADGTAVRYFTAGPAPALTDPLTGDIIHLPPFIDGRWEGGNPSGIIYKDGTILLYSKYRRSYDGTAELTAALLRPGDDEWTLIQRTIESPYYGLFCITYHSGKILVTVERRLWHVVTTTATPSSNDILVRLTPSSMPLKYGGYFYEYGHVLESCDELLWASVHTRTDIWKETEKGGRGLARAFLVSVHVLEEAPDHPRWVRKKGKSLANLVLFLGWPNSFSVEASRLGMNGGFAYFTRSANQSGVYKYNLVDNTTEFIECLPEGWYHDMCTWLVPQPTIAPLHHGLATTPRSNSMIRRERRHGP